MGMPRNNPGSDIQEAPGGLSIHITLSSDKLFGFGEETKLGELDVPDIHCFALKICEATSSPTVHGWDIKIDLNKLISGKQRSRYQSSFTSMSIPTLHQRQAHVNISSPEITPRP